MLCRERASVEEGRVEGRRVDEGNERGRDGTRHGGREGKRGGRKRAEERLRKEGRGNRSKGGREGNFKGGSIFTNQPFTNRPLLLGLWYYKGQIVNMYTLLTLYCDASEYIV